MVAVVVVGQRGGSRGRGRAGAQGVVVAVITADPGCMYHYCSYLGHLNSPSSSKGYADAGSCSGLQY